MLVSGTELVLKGCHIVILMKSSLRSLYAARETSAGS